MYEKLVERLRYCAVSDNQCLECKYRGGSPDGSKMCIDLLMVDAADAIEELSKPRWIPVTERCPEKSGDYLVFDDCRNLYVNEWHYLLKKWQYDDSRITHWMPLPEPPKEWSDGVEE